MKESNKGRMQVLKEIDTLENRHCSTCSKVSYENTSYCINRCPIGAKIKQLGDKLQLQASDKREKEIKSILKKGLDMTKSDIRKLLDSNVKKGDIRKVLKMDPVTFSRMMNAYGFTKPKARKKVTNSRIKMTVEEFVRYRYEDKLSIRQIASKFDVVDGTLFYWIRRNSKEIEELMITIVK
jgi:hypothetical protein